MKRRITKKMLRKEEQNLKHTLKAFLANANNENYEFRLRRLNSALTHLLGVHLQLDPSWDHKQRWLDDIEWNSLSTSGTTLNGKGKIWWGCRTHTSAALVAVEFEARLQVRSSGRFFGIAYFVTFEDEGIRFCIRQSRSSLLRKLDGNHRSPLSSLEDSKLRVPAKVNRLDSCNGSRRVQR